MTTVDASTDASTVAEQLLSGIERAWNLADGTASGEAFAEDADFVDIRGGHHRGRDVIAVGHQALFDSVYAGSTIRYHLSTARLVGPDCLVAVAEARLDTPAGPAAGVSHARLTAVLLTSVGGAGWSVTAFHNALVGVDS